MNRGTRRSLLSRTTTAAAVAPAISSAAPAAPAPGAYTHTYTATGTAPITFSVSAGALPAGLSLDGSSGVLSGTVTQRGAYSWTVAATNSAGSDSQAASGTTYTQTLGSELVTNGNMESGSPPSNWSAATATLSAAADERTGGSGAQSLQVARNGAATAQATQTITLSAGDVVELDGWMRNVDATSVSFRNTATIIVPTYTGTTWKRIKYLQRFVGNFVCRPTASATVDGTSGRFDDVSVKKLTLNTTDTAAADGTFIIYFTLPASPLEGQRVFLRYRVQDTANFWACYVQRTAAGQWDLLVDSVAAGTATNRKTVANVGTINGLKIVTSGDDHTIYTTTDGGENWTVQGAAINNAALNTQTGVLALYSSDVTPGRNLW